MVFQSKFPSQFDHDSFSHGGVLEQNLASEALGLVRSLDWEIIKGPRGQQEEDEEVEDVRQEIEGGAGRSKPVMHDPNDTVKAVKEEKIKDGTYVYSVATMEGVYYRGGIIYDEYEKWNAS